MKFDYREEDLKQLNQNSEILKKIEFVSPNNTNYLFKDNPRIENSPKNFRKINVNSDIAEKSSESNYNEASTSGSNIPKIRNENKHIFNFDIFENFDNLGRTPNFQPLKEDEQKITKFLDRRIKVNIKKWNNTRFKVSIQPENIGVNSIFSSKIDKSRIYKITSIGNKNENDENLYSLPVERTRLNSNSGKISPYKNENLIQEKSRTVGKYLRCKTPNNKNIVQFLSPLMKHQSFKNDLDNMTPILPIISSNRNSEKINREINNIFYAAKNFGQDPEVKNKIENLRQNILDIQREDKKS
jgi:hypothetical protein